MRHGLSEAGTLNGPTIHNVDCVSYGPQLLQIARQLCVQMKLFSLLFAQPLPHSTLSPPASAKLSSNQGCMWRAGTPALVNLIQGLPVKASSKPTSLGN